MRGVFGHCCGRFVHSLPQQGCAPLVTLDVVSDRGRVCASVAYSLLGTTLVTSVNGQSPGKLAIATVALAAVLVACAGSTTKPDIASPKAEAPQPTCLALSVGGAAGVAHLGAIESLRAHDVEISCVVGNSMGSLVGALYANNPHADTTEAFRTLLNEYRVATQQSGLGRTATGALLGAAVLGPFGFLLGGAIGASSFDEVNHTRLISMLDRQLAGTTIEAFPIPYETSHMERRGEKIELITSRDGNAAAAVGGSIANPFIFDEIDVRRGGGIDPGMDRVAAVPIEHACEAFPDHLVLAVNVMPQPSFVSAQMHCPAFEIRIAVPPVEPAARVFEDPVVFQQVVAAGRDATEAWFATSEGRKFLASARRASLHEQGTASRAPRGSPLGPQSYTVEIAWLELGPHKASGAEWDGSGDGPPDPHVVVEVEGRGHGKLSSPIAQDTLMAAWDEVAEMQIADGDMLKIAVWDMDALADDHVISLSVPFVGPKRYVLKEPSQSLSELIIEVRKAP